MITLRRAHAVAYALGNEELTMVATQPADVFRYATVSCRSRIRRLAREAGPPVPQPPRLLDRVRADGAPGLMACLLYGAGLRVLECCRLRVQDVDFGASQIVVRGGKGDKDRVTMLPAVIKTDLAAHLQAVRAQHEEDLAAGAGWVELPTALARKYPHAGREWTWQWVFPATRSYRDRVTGQRRRLHLHESVCSGP
jgi:integrase